ncbi:MAG: thioredoxin fold domain-containing protein [Muribaculaceae bacterium]|nr:thioredoxin fold domain-containing protein [Muribaculaceae bacterium]
MKSIRLFPFLAAAAITTLTSCGGSPSKDAATDADPTRPDDEVIENATESPAVITIKADGQIPPADGKLIVLDFNATWCGPCRQFAPNFESVADKYRGQASFYSIDVDQNPRLAAQFNVQGIPTVVYIQPDGTTSSTTGYLDAATFDAAVSARLN